MSTTTPRVISHLSPQRMGRPVSMVPWTGTSQPIPAIPLLEWQFGGASDSLRNSIIEFRTLYALSRWLVEKGGQYSILSNNGTIIVDKIVDGRAYSIYQEIQES